MVFYTNVVLKIVILFVRLKSVLRRYVISEAGLKKWKPETSKKEILQCFSISRKVFISKGNEFYRLLIVHYSRLRGYFCLCNIVIEVKNL